MLDGLKLATLVLAGALSALAAIPSAFARDRADDGSCVVTGKDTAAGARTCRGGPLKAGDSRLGTPAVPRTMDRGQPSGHSFQVGGSTVTISGSIRVEGVYSR